MHGVQHWTNWAGNVRCLPSQADEPATEGEIVALVRRAANTGGRVKVVGAGHSCSPIAAPDQAHLVSLRRYHRVLAVDRQARTVTVQAGIRLADLNTFLAAHGLALSNLGAIAEQSVAGAISTGTHGTGVRFGGLAEQVIGLTLVTAEGEVLALSAQREPDIFAAAKVGLGCLGVISTATLACEPRFNLQLLERPASLAGTLRGLDHLLQAEHFGFWWVPHTGRVYQRAANRTTRAAAGQAPAPLAWVRDVLLGSYAHAGALWATRSRPGVVPHINRTFRHLLFGRVREQIGRSDRIFTSTIRVRQEVMEYALPLGQAGTALRQLSSLTDERGFHAHLPVDVRFSAADTAWLSPAYGRPTCYIGIIAYRPFGRDLPHEAYFRAVDELLSSLGGRPHWGKRHYRSGADLRGKYPRWDAFQAVRAHLDPNGMFLNAHLEHLFAQS